jgi:hypothetical protein
LNRRRRRSRPLSFPLAAAAGIGLGIAGGLWLARAELPDLRGLLRTEPFRLRAIDWVGLHSLEPHEATALLGKVAGIALVDLDVEKLAAKISALPRVRGCRGVRIPPDRLVMRVEERVPLGRSAGEPVGFDASGDRFPLRPGEERRLVAVRGEPQDAIPLLLAAQARGVELAEVDARAPGDLRFRVPGSAVLIRAGEDVARALGDLERLRGAGLLERVRPRELDLRFRGSAVLRGAPPQTKGG